MNSISYRIEIEGREPFGRGIKLSELTDEAIDAALDLFKRCVKKDIQDVKKGLTLELPK